VNCLPLDAGWLQLVNLFCNDDLLSRLHGYQVRDHPHMIAESQSMKFPGMDDRANVMDDAPAETNMALRLVDIGINSLVTAWVVGIAISFK